MTDTAKKFRILVNNVERTKEPWYETYVEVTDDPEQWGRDTIERFNATLRPGEKARVFLGAELIEDELAPVNHNWEKQNLFTRYHLGGNRPYDDMKCERCGVRGKRFGLNSYVKRIAPYRAKVYERCDTAVAWLKKKERMKGVEE